MARVDRDAHAYQGVRGEHDAGRFGGVVVFPVIGSGRGGGGDGQSSGQCDAGGAAQPAHPVPHRMLLIPTETSAGRPVLLLAVPFGVLPLPFLIAFLCTFKGVGSSLRSEERRVGKEGGGRRSAE